MNFSDEISQKFSMFYGEIDSQMSRLRKTDSFFNQLSTQSDDVKMLHRIEKGEVSSKEVDELIKSAKEFGAELEGLRVKVAKRKIKSASMKSSMPPMWDEGKLNNYIESIIGEVFESSEGNEVRNSLNQVEDRKLKPRTGASVVKPILKTEKSKISKRNVSTNVKFQIHQPKLDNKKIQTQLQAPLKRKESIFPCRIVNKDGSVDVTFGKHFETETESMSATAQTDLKYSPMTVTSTAESIKSAEQYPHTSDEDDLLSVVESRLATPDLKCAKQMTTRCLPVLSIKGSCSTQKIYQLEISPSRDIHLSNDENRHKNTKFAEFVYQQSKPSSKVHYEAPIPAQPPTENLENLNDENENQSNFFDARSVNRMLSECGIHLRDGKVHVVVEKSGIRRSNKKTRARKSLTPSTLRKSIDDLEESKKDAGDNEAEKINICDVDGASILVETNKKIEKEVQINEIDSSMSSSITDDGKLRQILKINRGGDERRKRSSDRHSSSDSYPTSTGNCDNSFRPQTPVDVGSAVKENFQSIYKLIEETFQPTQPAAADVNENEKEIDDDGMKQMREIIKMSEENIKRAGILLQKYQKNDEPSSNKIETKISTRHSAILIEASETEKDEKSTKVIVPSVNRDVQGNNDDMQEISNSYQTRTNESTSSKKETVDSCVQTAEDKNIQTDGNLNWKSRQYFGNVYEKFSNFNHIKFDQSPLPSARHNPYCSPLSPCKCFGCEKRRSFQVLSHQSLLDSGKSPPEVSTPEKISAFPKLSVPYNPIYSDDDEVMKAANKFLRSEEKRRNRNTDSDVTSSESSNNFTPQKLYTGENSSSISTPSSSLLNNVMQSAINEHRPIPRARHNLDIKLQATANEIVPTERKLQDIEPLSDEAQSTRSSSSASPQFKSSDLQLNQEFFERYLSEGEVLSQGEIQLGLSEDDDVPDDF